MKKIFAFIIIAIALLAAPSVMAEGFSQGWVTCDVLNVRSAPDVSSSIVCQIRRGTEMTLLYCNGLNWYCVELQNGTTGFCSADYITTENSYVYTGGSDLASNIITMAKSLLGKPYVYGASGPNSFDCSGFTSYVFSANGISLPRTSIDQSGVGTTISMNELQPGDLVFFATGSSSVVNHVGIYIGDGDIIHAATSQGKISINNLSQSYYASRYKWAKRVF